MSVTNIVRAVVKLGSNYTVTAPIVKEDYGLYLKIEGLELPQTYEVDFSNSENNGTSVTMIGNSDGVLIPHQFISTGKDVFAFLYHVGEDFGRTVYKFRIPNKVRPDRTNEEPTPEEQSVIDQTISALNDAVDRAEDAEQAIEDMSVSATTLSEGSSATVTKTESEGVVHLEFGIPTGATGAKGDKGDTGATGDTGSAGADAKINGVNTLTIEAGTNISLDQEGNTLTINSTGGGGTSDYTQLTNKPKINNVELNGNKTSSDLGLQPAGNYALESDIPTKTSDLNNDSGFIDKNVNNLTNYYKTSETYNKTEIDNKISSVYKYKGTVATYANLPSSDLTVGDVYNVESTGDNYAWTGTVWDKLGGDIDLSGYQPKIDSTHKLSSDLVDDTGNTNKFVTSTDKTNWNAKYDKPSGGIPKTDLASDVQTSLGKADTALQSETYTGTITGITMNGASKGTSGVVDLGTVITSHQDISGKANKISVVQTSASTIEINSNTFYKFGEVASLNITLASITDNTIYNEYMFEFVSGTTATTLTLPSSIKWLETPTIDANKIYQCSIVDNIGLLVGVANV